MFENLTGENLKEEFKNNKAARLATYGIAGVAVIAILYFAYQMFIFNPKNEDSKNANYVGLNYADMDSVDIAIEELSPVVKKFDGTVGGEVAQFVLARQHMEKGEFEKALELLKDVKTKDTYVRVHAVGLQGDCYSEMKQYEDAVSKYNTAAEMDNNDYTTPMYLFKAGLLSETKLNDAEAALEYYQAIKDEFMTFSTQKQIDRYIARASNKKMK